MRLTEEEYAALLDRGRKPFTEVTRRRRDAMSEKYLRECYRKLATALGWKLLYHTRDSRDSDEGWPDDVLGHEGAARVVFVEAKNATRPATPKQGRWLALLTAAGHEAYLWRPAQWHDGTIERVLTATSARPAP